MSENEITITILGHVGVGKSAVALAILDALRTAGLACTWDDEQSERNLGTGAADIAAMEDRPSIRLIELNPTMLPESPIGRLQLRQGQIQQLADFAGAPVDGAAEEDQDVLQLTLGHTGHSGPGLYASFDDVPEGGAIFLGIPEGDPQLLFGTDLPHPANGEERRWFMAGANAMAKGLALVNYGDSESQYIADLDDDAHALAVARRFTSDNDPQERATLQVAIVNAMARARSAQQADNAGPSALHAELLELIGATSHEEAAGLIAHWRGSALVAIRRAESLDRRLTDAMRLAWMLVNAGGGSVTIKWEDLAKVDWSTAHLHREEDPEMRGLTLRAKP